MERIGKGKQAGLEQTGIAISHAAGHDHEHDKPVAVPQNALAAGLAVDGGATCVVSGGWLRGWFRLACRPVSRLL